MTYICAQRHKRIPPWLMIVPQLHNHFVPPHHHTCPRKVLIHIYYRKAPRLRRGLPYLFNSGCCANYFTTAFVGRKFGISKLWSSFDFRVALKPRVASFHIHDLYLCAVTQPYSTLICICSTTAQPHRIHDLYPCCSGTTIFFLNLWLRYYCTTLAHPCFSPTPR
jgi:hypothetical protein